MCSQGQGTLVSARPGTCVYLSQKAGARGACRKVGEEKGHGHCTPETINEPAGHTTEVSKEQSISYRNWKTLVKVLFVLWLQKLTNFRRDTK